MKKSRDWTRVEVIKITAMRKKSILVPPTTQHVGPRPHPLSYQRWLYLFVSLRLVLKAIHQVCATGEGQDLFSLS
jgi:hypothetical protein